MWSVLRIVVVTVVIVAVGAAAWLAGDRAADTAPPPPPAAAPPLVTATTGVLVDQGPVQVVARWRRTSTYQSRRAGTVTKVMLPTGTTSTIGAGSALFELDTAPVIAMRGEVPAYRDLGPGADGPDLAQLQQFLLDAGYFTGAVDGKWGPVTSAAVTRWQDASGIARSTTLPLGTVVFVPDLPSLVTAAPDLVRGAVLADGAPIFDEVAAAPSFAVRLPPGPSEGLGPGLSVVVTVSTTALDFTTSDKQTTDDDGTTTIPLDPAAPLTCARWCDAVPTDDTSAWPGVVTRAGPAEGVVVPVGALRSGTGEELFVVLADGSNVPVDVRLQVGASAIVSGVDDGAEIELPTPGAG